MLGECTLKRRPKVWLKNILLNGFGVGFLDSLNHFTEEVRERYPGKVCGEPSRLMAQIPMTCTRGLQKCCLSRNATPRLKGKEKQRLVELFFEDGALSNRGLFRP